MIETIENLEENIKSCSINPMDLKHLKIEALNSKYTVALTDFNGRGILKRLR